MLKKYLVKSATHKMVIYWTGCVSSLRVYASQKWACPESAILLLKEL